MSTDDAILRASLSDPARFEAVFDRYHADVWAYLSRSGGRQLADDLAGHVFVVAFERRASFDPALGHLHGWLFGIARNLMHARRRSEARGIRAFARVASRREPTADQAQDIVDADEVHAERQRVLDALERLPADDRELLVLAVWEGFAYAQIAELIGVPIGTVRSRLSRARQRLRELVERSGQEPDVPTRLDGTR